MRLALASAAVLILASPGARAADLPARAPADGPAPGAAPPVQMVAVAPAPLWLECSPYTGQPITVIYNEPGRTPWSVRPDLALLPLGGAKPLKTKAVYPRGY